MPLKLKALVQDINTVPEALRDAYEQTEEGWVLDVDDKDFKGKVKEFRSNNETLKKSLSTMQEQFQVQADKYKDIDPAKYAEAIVALDNLSKIEEGDLIKAGKFDEVVTRRTKLMGQEFENQLGAQKRARELAEQRAQQYQQKLGYVLVDAEAHKAITGVATPRKGAMSDIMARARNAWECDDEGNLKARGEGLFNEKGEPMTMDDYARRLVTDAPHLFEASQGGGSQGGRPGNSNRQGPKVVSRDPVTVGRNLEDIASGRVQVEGYGNE